MDNRIERIAVPVSISEEPAQSRKPAASKAAIEQTPNTRGGYLVAFAAGLLTCSSLPRLPSLVTSGRLRQPFLELTAASTVPDSHRIPF